MKVSDIITKCSFELLIEADTGRDITGVYAGDLLSWVMGHGEEGQCLVTIMSNVNVLAVASLLDFSCVILAENVKPDEEFLALAKEKEINDKFVKEAAAAGLVNLKGHRLVGGMRASIYNAMTIEGVKALVEFMKKFAKENA